ncbi:MAG: ribonuclease R [Oligoflexia bacterium]
MAPRDKSKRKTKSFTKSFKDRSGKTHFIGDGGGDVGGDTSGRERAQATAGRTSVQPERRGRKPHGQARSRNRTLRGTVDKNRKGFGFVQFEDRKVEDLFLPPHLAESVFHGDRVEVELGSSGEVRKLLVLEHRFREIVGRFSPSQAGQGARARFSGWVIYERKKAREEVFIPEAGPRAKLGDWVRCSIEFHESGPHRVTAEIIEVYGQELPASADVQMISAEYGLIEDHSDAAEEEARAFRLEIPGKDLDGREDLRQLPFITIDGETARDFDDAVYVERVKSGYRLWVAIADVSHYVTPGSALDEEALSRGTSVYFPERAFHMLPTALSTQLCSLRPDEPRLSMVAAIDYDRNGSPGTIEVMEAVIESQRRATYTEIEAERASREHDSQWEFKAHFELYRLIRKKRTDRGSIDFDLPEADVVVDNAGEPVEIVNRSRNDAHRLIEEFMIAANEAVTRWMMKRSWPFVYRVHDEPALAALERFEELASSVGVPVKITHEDGGVSPKILADIVKRAEGHPAQDLLNMALLRSLKQAIYSSTHGIHYGLASEAYTHFTSPIRRYPDLVVHRLIRWALRIEKRIESPLNRHERDELEKQLAEICDHCSYRERVAAEADREAIRLKQVRLMKRHLGDEFDAKVVGMSEVGMFVQLATPFCEGLVSRDSMADDFYEFNEDRMVFFGRRTRKTYTVGQPVRVQVLRADLDRRQIDFGMVGAVASPEENSGERSSPERLWGRQKSPRRRR